MVRVVNFVGATSERDGYTFGFGAAVLCHPGCSEIPPAFLNFSVVILITMTFFNKFATLPAMLKDKLAPYIPALVARETTGRAVAKALKANEQSVSRALKRMKIKRTPARGYQPKMNQTAISEAVKMVKAKTLTVTQAAQKAGCSTRTIYRCLCSTTR